MKTAAKEITCYGQSNTGNWCQEWYESAARTAGRRARVLRKLGYHVTVCSMGAQVTPVGIVKMTMVDIRPGANEDTFYLPTENWKLERTGR